MLNPADVNRIACLYVSKAADYFRTKMYTLYAALDPIYFHSYVLATELSDCIEYEDECKIKALSKDVDISNEDIVNPCANAFEIGVLLTTDSCGELTNIGFTSTPKITLVQNSYYHQVRANFSWRNGCDNAQTVMEVNSGYERTAPFTVSAFNQDLNLRFGSTATLFIPLSPSAYISSIRLYYTEANGSGEYYEDFDTSPARITDTTWTSCPTCSKVVANDLLFGASDSLYRTAFHALLSNISNTRFGANYMSYDVTKTSNSITLKSYIRNVPYARHMGFNPKNLLVSFYNPLTSQTTARYFNFKAGESKFFSTTFYMARKEDVIFNCSSAPPIFVNNLNDIVAWGVYNDTPISQSNSSWKEIKLTTDLVGPSYASTPLTYELTTPFQPCAFHYGNAYIIPSDPLATYQWINPLNAIISNEARATIGDEGIHEITVTSKGCTLKYYYEFIP